MTAYDLKLYTCQDCHYHLGNKKFNEHVLKKYKYNGYKRLVCTQCQTISEASAIKRRKKKRIGRWQTLPKK